MSSIRILSDRVANQIAAGEVIERPAAVIKELVENSLDAGATRIEVEFRHGGRSYMRVEDNGKGMSKDDAEAVKWHRKAGVVTHVFTHFPLELVVYTARVAARTRAPEGLRWVPVVTLADEALPNVMRKAIAHGLNL